VDKFNVAMETVGQAVGYKAHDEGDKDQPEHITEKIDQSGESYPNYNYFIGSGEIGYAESHLTSLLYINQLQV